MRKLENNKQQSRVEKLVDDTSSASHREGERSKTCQNQDGTGKPPPAAHLDLFITHCYNSFFTSTAYIPQPDQ